MSTGSVPFSILVRHNAEFIRFNATYVTALRLWASLSVSTHSFSDSSIRLAVSASVDSSDITGFRSDCCCSARLSLTEGVGTPVALRLPIQTDDSGLTIFSNSVQSFGRSFGSSKYSSSSVPRILFRSLTFLYLSVKVFPSDPLQLQCYSEYQINATTFRMHRTTNEGSEGFHPLSFSS